MTTILTGSDIDVRNEEKEDELVTRAAALVIDWMRKNLKNELKVAIEEIRKDYWTTLVGSLIHNNLVRLLGGLLFLLAAIGFWMHDHT